MTSPSAQKAAAEICGMLKMQLGSTPGTNEYMEAIAHPIQQAITEAVDAAVAPKDKRVKELEAALRETLEHLADLSKPSECDVCNRGRKALEAPHEP